MTTTVTSKASLLDDPATVALLRDLYAEARKRRTKHRLYPTYPSGPTEHVFGNGVDRVSVFDGFLFYERHGHLLLKARTSDVRQAAQLLAAVGVLPERFTGGAR